VDIKITDYCPYGCAFCYQGSTEKGKHADKNYLYQLASNLEELKVFEVAIGGGEPTLHPDFWEILRMFKWRNIVPNFTTANLAWLRDDGLVKAVLDCGGAFAYSVQRKAQVNDLAHAIGTSNFPTGKVNVQVVMGAVSEGDLESILIAADVHGFRVTLLGYKEYGRGKDFKPYVYDGWPLLISKLHQMGPCPHIGIDTALAAQYASSLGMLGIPKYMYEVKEGKFSMYVDAVTKQAAASSYVDGIVPLLEPLAEKIRTTFAGF
jgi:hypothetical protein